MDSAFIDDGYTCEDVPIEGHGEFPDFTITYRPMLARDRERLAIGLFKAQESGDNDRMAEWQQRICDAVAGQLVRWSLKDRSGKSVRIAADILPRLHKEAWAQVYSLIAGYSVPKKPDEPSEAETDEKN